MIISSRILSESLKNNARNKTQELRGGGGKEEKRNNKILMIISKESCQNLSRTMKETRHKN